MGQEIRRRMALYKVPALAQYLPGAAVVLVDEIDTHDAVAAAHKVVIVTKEMEAEAARTSWISTG